MTDEQKIEQLASHYEAILRLVGEDPEREGLLKTPMRAAKAMWYITRGYRQNASEVVKQAIFDYAGSKMIVVKDIEFYSLCEHHILPFFGKVTVGYVPHDKMIGLSKLARVVDVYARRLQVQERLTNQICKEIFQTLPAKGVMVRIEAQHLCMKMRGVEKQDSATVTTDYIGVFETDHYLRDEFLRNC